jgi:hypothetical protein
MDQVSRTENLFMGTRRGAEEAGFDSVAAETAARALRDFAPDDVEAGRRYVHAYVDYVHFVEELHGLVSAGAGTHAATAEPHSH